MAKISGNLLKMKNELIDNMAHYYLPIGDEKISMNKLVGKKIKLSFSGDIFDIVSGEKIKKSYNNGYSYKNFISLAQCDLCIVKPELCHFHKGTCREPEWGEKNCMIDHIIYLSVSSNLKIGITRHLNVPHRWIDQGATKALPILRVKDRLTSGLIESEISKEYKDKTNWRKMLKGEAEDDDLDLITVREQIFESYGDLLDDLEADDIDEEVIEINYPIESVPEKIKSIGFDKVPEYEGKLTGIKGQYLIFEDAVMNMRKHAGYSIELDY